VAPWFPDFQVDRSLAVPVHAQLREALRVAIEDGRWSAGDALPAESAMAAHYGISRATVREALAALCRERVISARKGSGSFVLPSATPAWFVASAGGFFEDPSNRTGPTVRSAVLRARVEVLPTWACEALALPARSEGGTIERLRWVDERIALYIVNHVLVEYAGALLAGGLERQSLYDRLRVWYGGAVAGGRRIIHAAAATDGIAALLQVPPGAPLLTVESLSWDAKGRPFECHRGWIRSENLALEIQVGHPANALDRWTRTLPISETASRPRGRNGAKPG
jgi:GntR family transcriptional regulator